MRMVQTIDGPNLFKAKEAKLFIGVDGRTA